MVPATVVVTLNLLPLAMPGSRGIWFKQANLYFRSLESDPWEILTPGRQPST